MSTRIHVVSDLHFRHRRIVELTGRPVDFEEIICDRWRRLVKEDDLVINLGDVILGQRGQLSTILASLPGIHVCCAGNHDSSPGWLMRHGFAFACQSFIRRDLVFSHEPMVPLPPGVRYSVHGHWHAPLDPHRRDQWLLDNPGADLSRYILVSIEKTLAPILLDDLIRDHERRWKVQRRYQDVMPVEE